MFVGGIEVTEDKDPAVEICNQNADNIDRNLTLPFLDTDRSIFGVFLFLTSTSKISAFF